MNTTIEQFFIGLNRHRDPLLEHAMGTVRFDIDDAGVLEHRYVTIDRGDVTVADRADPADCVVRGSGALFAGVGRGEVDTITAYLRGELVAEGDLELLLLFQRVFPRADARSRAS